MKIKMLFALFVFFSFKSLAQTHDYWLLIGTNTSNGIYVYKFHSEEGTADLVSSYVCKNPGYLNPSADEKFVYSVTEAGGATAGNLRAFTFDKQKGVLSFINSQTSSGANPVYVSVDKANRWAIVANYTAGNLSAVPILPDGSLGTPAQVITHTGSSIVAGRQDAPHVHSVIFSPDEKLLIASDLGTDSIIAYPFNATQNQPLDVASKLKLKTVPGSGPRHVAFYQPKNLMYVIEELSGKVAGYTIADTGFISRFDIVSDIGATVSGADIHVSPDNKFLYTSNRANTNNIAIFSIDTSNGNLSNVGYQSTLGTTPRNFMIDPTGNYLLVANQGSGTVVIFKRDKQTGLLTDTGRRINVSSPMCLKMVDAGQSKYKFLGVDVKVPDEK